MSEKLGRMKAPSKDEVEARKRFVSKLKSDFMTSDLFALCCSVATLPSGWYSVSFAEGKSRVGFTYPRRFTMRHSTLPLLVTGTSCTALLTPAGSDFNHRRPHRHPDDTIGIVLPVSTLYPIPKSLKVNVYSSVYAYYRTITTPVSSRPAITDSTTVTRCLQNLCHRRFQFSSL